jgi:phosphoribosylformylglycinamidine synthase
MLANGSVPKIDLLAELAVQSVCLEAAEAGLLRSAHDCSDGGLAIALAESCFSSLNRDAIGANVSLPKTLSDTPLNSPTSTTLFSETPSRIIISFPESSREAIEGLSERKDCPLTIIGRVGGDQLQISAGEDEAISANVRELESVWRGSLSKKLEAEVMAAGRE